MKPKKLTNQNIIVTGAAGRIGSATAHRLLTEGANVVLVDICSASLEKLVNELMPHNQGTLYPLTVDLTKPDEVDSLIERATNLVGVVDAAVHCAYPRSKGWGTPFEDLSHNYLCQDLSMQLGSAIMLSQQLMRYFELRKKGVLIHLSSIQGVSAPKFSHYAGTDMSSPIEYAAIKAAIISITKWLAKYYANKGIRVNCVSPGGILDSQPDEFLERYRDSCTNIGMLSADHVASVLVFLLSEDAEAINGQNIIVDDGWTL